MISGFKGKSLTIEKIVKMDRNHLIKQAGSKYDPEMTVVRAKALRLKSSDTQPIETKSEEKKIEEVPNLISQEQTVFLLPDSTKKINELITIIQTHKGDQEITIHNKKFFLNDDGIQKIQDLFAR